MSDWITDRLPTRDDADYEGTVWITRDEMVERTVFLNVMLRQAWMPIDEPPPYQPPALEPDTSLAASCDRLEVWYYDEDVAEYLNGKVLTCEDGFRIIEAARRWDDSMQETTELADAVANDPDGVGEAARKFDFHSDAREDLLFLINDPDGVGDGWRLLRDGEVIQPGDQFKMNDRWYLIHDPGKTHGGTAIRRRRRIEVER